MRLVHVGTAGTLRVCPSCATPGTRLAPIRDAHGPLDRVVEVVGPADPDYLTPCPLCGAADVATRATVTVRLGASPDDAARRGLRLPDALDLGADGRRVAPPVR